METKYLKYKNKYLSLKNSQLGGYIHDKNINFNISQASKNNVVPYVDKNINNTVSTYTPPPPPPRQTYTPPASSNVHVVQTHTPKKIIHITKPYDVVYYPYSVPKATYYRPVYSEETRRSSRRSSRKSSRKSSRRSSRKSSRK